MRPLGAKYSPAPWSVAKKSKLTGAVVAEDGEIVCDPTGAGRYEDEAEANANLISAAPELLDALKEAVLKFGCHTHMLAIEQGECNGFVHDEWRCTLPDGKCFIQRWLAAIRKAEGMRLTESEWKRLHEVKGKVLKARV